MSSQKKQLVSILAVLLALCAASAIAGIVMTVFNWGVISDNQSKVDRAKTAYGRLIDQRDNLSISRQNIEDGEALRKKLIAAAIKRFQTVTNPVRWDAKDDKEGDPTAFRSMLIERTQKLGETCQSHGIQLSDDAKNFGFSRYIVQGDRPEKEKLSRLNTQVEVIAAIVEELAEASKERRLEISRAGIDSEKAPWTKIMSVKRQVISPSQKHNPTKDELIVRPAKEGEELGLTTVSDSTGKTDNIISLRRGKYTYAFVVTLDVVTDTGTIRKFLNSLKKYSIYIDDLAVSPAPENVFPRKKREDQNQAKANTSNDGGSGGFDFGFFGGSSPEKPSAAPSPRVPAKTVVVEEIPSEFSLTFEYLSLFNFDGMRAEDAEDIDTDYEEETGTAPAAPAESK